jgi:hypothetical protein
MDNGKEMARGQSSHKDTLILERHAPVALA